MMNREPSDFSIESIVQKIAALQSAGDRYFPEGGFPSHRQNTSLFYSRPDSNLFYTASVVFVLNQLKSLLPLSAQQLVEEITGRAIKNYPAYQNKDGLKTYNFWQTPGEGRVSGHFPNGYVFNRLEHFRLPDDIDDTSLVYLTSRIRHEEVIWLKKKLQLHANLSEGPQKTRRVKNTFRHYRNLRVYSTWFGKNMAIEFDACALCNLMYLFETHQLPYNEYDNDTYTYLKGIIDRKEFIGNPFLASHNYATAPLIVYHFARLLGTFEIKPLENCRETLIATALDLFKTEKSVMNKVILLTSLLRLSRKTDFGYKELIDDCLHTFSLSTVRLPDPGFCYFLGPLLSSYEHPFLQMLAPLKITQMEWKCEAHEWALLLEYLIERNKN